MVFGTKCHYFLAIKVSFSIVLKVIKDAVVAILKWYPQVNLYFELRPDWSLLGAQLKFSDEHLQCSHKDLFPNQAVDTTVEHIWIPTPKETGQSQYCFGNI